MSAGNIADVMDEIGIALGAIPGLRVFDFPPSSAQPPFAFVDMPESIEFDATMGRGADRVTLSVVVGVAAVIDRSARDDIAAFAAGSGARSVRAALSGQGIGRSLRVQSVQFRPVALSSGTYAGAIFDVDVAF